MLLPHGERLLGLLLLFVLFVVQSLVTYLLSVIVLPAVGALLGSVDVLEAAVSALADSLRMVTTDWHVLVFVIIAIVAVVVIVIVVAC